MKRAFTMIELIATLGILMILFSLGFGGINRFLDIKSVETNKNFIKEVRMLISIGKKIAISENKSVSITIDVYRSNVSLIVDTRVKYKVDIPNNLRFISPVNIIRIKSRGRIEPFSWIFTDGTNKYKISRPVEGDYINESHEKI